MAVTPCVGVWIETSVLILLEGIFNVTPCVGVWIETTAEQSKEHPPLRHTLRGCVD